MVDQSIKTELFALQLGQQLLDAYQFRLFGNVSKPEIDIMVFSCAVKILLSDHECVRNSNGEINWLRLSTGEFIRIGTHLKLSKACVQSLVEQAYAFDHDSEFSAQEVIEELLALLQSSESTSDHGQPGAIKLQVSNPATRLALESFFVTSGESLTAVLLGIYLFFVLQMFFRHCSPTRIIKTCCSNRWWPLLNPIYPLIKPMLLVPKHKMSYRHSY